MIRQTICAVALLCWSSGFADSAGAAGMMVDSEANWAAHLNLEKLKTTESGRAIMAELDKETHKRNLDALQAVLRFDPRRQLKSVTVFGKGAAKDDGVIVLRGEFEPDHLVTLVKANRDYTSSQHRGSVIHSWIDDKDRKRAEAKGDSPKRSYGTFIASNLLIIGSDRESLASAVDLHSGQRRGIDLAEWLSSSSPAGAAGAFAVAGARVEKLAHAHPQAAMLKNARMAEIYLGETDGAVQGVLRLSAANPEIGEALKKITDGILALWHLKDAKNPVENELARSARVEADGAGVTVSWKIQVDTLKQAVQQTIKKN